MVDKTVELKIDRNNNQMARIDYEKLQNMSFKKNTKPISKDVKDELSNLAGVEFTPDFDPNNELGIQTIPSGIASISWQKCGKKEDLNKCLNFYLTTNKRRDVMARAKTSKTTKVRNLFNKGNSCFLENFKV